MEISTIYALSSGTVPSGVAIVRMSGPKVRFAFETMIGLVPKPKKASYKKIFFPNTKNLIDQGIILYFQEPESFSGEDCGEFHIHGGQAVVSALLNALGSIDGFVAAEAGEFSRRAFENGKLDLVELEGLSDLVSSRTEMQRQLALIQSGGLISDLYNGWRAELIGLRSNIEAAIEFAEEEDVQDVIDRDLITVIRSLISDIGYHMAGKNVGEIIQGGYRVALMGPPNSGKSSLLNALARRDVSIVSPTPGTTRDIVEVHLDVDGYELIVSDTAGIRESADEIENEGVRRALDRAISSDLIVWLWPIDAADPDMDELKSVDRSKILVVRTKVDLKSDENVDAGTVCTTTLVENGISSLVEEMRIRVSELGNKQVDLLVFRKRHIESLISAQTYLKEILGDTAMDADLVSECLRLASTQLDRIIGRIDVEDLLESIFSRFCIGK